MNQSRRFICMVFCLVIITISISQVPNILTVFRDDSNEKVVLLNLYKRIQIGDHRKRVEVIVDKDIKKTWKLEKNNERLKVQTPWRFGSGNWNLYIVFSKDRVVRVAIRNSDDFDSPPESAPPDKIWHR